MTDKKQSNPKDLVGVRKAPMSCVPMNVVAEVGVAMLEGATKYGRHNYRAVGVRGSVYFDGTMRHLVNWWEGQDIDPDSELSEITKAIASLTVLRDGMLRGNWIDDRPPKSEPFYPDLNEAAGKVIDKYGHMTPQHYTEVRGSIKTETIYPDKNLAGLSIGFPEPAERGTEYTPLKCLHAKTETQSTTMADGSTVCRAVCEFCKATVSTWSLAKGEK